MPSVLGSMPSVTPQIVEELDPRKIALYRAQGVPEVEKPSLFSKLGGKVKGVKNAIGDKLSGLSDNERASLRTFGLSALAGNDGSTSTLQNLGRAGLNAQQNLQQLDYRDEINNLRELQELRLNRPRSQSYQQITQVLEDGREQKGFVIPGLPQSFIPLGSPKTPSSIGTDLGNALAPHLDKSTVRDLEGSVLSADQGITQIQDVIKSIEENPGSVGAIAGLRESIGGVVGQLFPAAGEAISPDELVETRTKFKTIIAPLVSTITGDTSGRYSNRDIEMTENASKALDAAANDQQATAALGVILSIMEGTQERNQSLLGPGNALSNEQYMPRADAEAFLRENNTPEVIEFFNQTYGVGEAEKILAR